MKGCKVKNCSKKYYGLGYCNKHYQQVRLCGKILKWIHRNEFIDCGDYYKICLYNKKGRQKMQALIDKKYYKKIKNYKWCLTKLNYVESKTNKKGIYLHQLILGKKEGFEIDHINHNTLDNRKQNLRFVTRNQNQWNRKNVKGYSWDKRDKKWEAYLMINKKYIHLGHFKNKQNAVNARRKAEKKYFKEFAYNENKLLAGN